MGLHGKLKSVGTKKKRAGASVNGKSRESKKKETTFGV
ncbi:hypothetical protein ES705_18115 [subsurface metagenome]